MRTATLVRDLFGPRGTFGALSVSGSPVTWRTVECPSFPWVPDNEAGRACIPAGTYPLRLGTYFHNTPDTGDDYPAYEVLGVPGRSLIKIHVANLASQLEGCIAPGMEGGFISGAPAVLRSRQALDAFMAALAGDRDAVLVIRSWRV